MKINVSVNALTEFWKKKNKLKIPNFIRKLILNSLKFRLFCIAILQKYLLKYAAIFQNLSKPWKITISGALQGQLM